MIGVWADNLAFLTKWFPEWMYRIDLSSTVNGGHAQFRLNLLAGLIVMFLTGIALFGMKSGTKANNLITTLNISVIVFIIATGLYNFKPANIDNFFVKGFSGVVKGAETMFFSYIGFDTICTLSAEAKRPKRDIPIAVLSTIFTATILYIGAGLSITGMVSYTSIDLDAPLIKAFESVELKWAGDLVGICAITCMTATLFACLLGQPRNQQYSDYLF